MRLCPVFALVLSLLMSALLMGGCSAQNYRERRDQAARSIIEQKQQQATGRTEPFTIERPADTLRRRLLLDQELPHSSPASLGTGDLSPIKHWPKDNYLSETSQPPDPSIARLEGQTLRLTLVDALQVAARNSREYQNRKEQLFLSALNRDVERMVFRATLTALRGRDASLNLGGQDEVAGVIGSADGSITQRFQSGLAITSRIAVDLVKLLTQDRSSSLGLSVDSTISMPLLRGAGRHIVAEPLTQAERTVVYDMLSFEQYKRSFSVGIARDYLAVLQQMDQLQNAEDSYRRVITSARRSRRLADAGRLPEIQVDQAIQEELRARERWITAQTSYARRLDAFKVTLGLPPDARIELDRLELERLAQTARPLLESAQAASATAPVQPAASRPGEIGPPTLPRTRPSIDEDVVLEPPGTEGAGPMELPEDRAILLALDKRPDLTIANGQVFDAQRRVVVAADALRMGLDLSARGSFGEGRSLGSAAQPDAQLRPEKGVYTIGALLNLPLDRTREASTYRSSLISLERATRALQELEDQVKLGVRNGLRTLQEARESVKTQAMALTVARRRVASTDLFLQAGRAEVRDLLESQDALVNAQNALTAAVVGYRIAELELQRDLGVLEVNHEGVWREYTPVENVP